ncbi:MAG: hypothetical protein DMF92_17780 [Acidobacteria bacterium]|nr:MAG: hypothetical protein DMF92_17780 [Acidobacteriota bacterium]
MTDMICGYGGDRDEVLVAYVYGDIEPAERTAFDAHLARCLHCRKELIELNGVRAQLEQWAPPDPLRALTRRSAPQGGPRARVWTTLAEMPAWAQVAAALVFLGVSAGLANLDVRYDREGLTVRTGWSAPAVMQGRALSVAQDGVNRRRSSGSSARNSGRRGRRASPCRRRACKLGLLQPTAPATRKCCGACARWWRTANANSSASSRCASLKSSAT